MNMKVNKKKSFVSEMDAEISELSSLNRSSWLYFCWICMSRKKITVNLDMIRFYWSFLFQWNEGILSIS